MLKLIIEDDEGRKTVVPFVRDEITIGRQEGNTIRLTERNVSRRHARLLRQNGHVLVEDLGSYTGVRINGERIQGPAQVADGDLIQIGDYDLALQKEAAAQPMAPTMRIPAEELQAALDEASSGSSNEESSREEDDDTTAPSPVEQRRHSTAVIRMDQVEMNRPRKVAALDPEDAPHLVVVSAELKGQEFACIRTELRIGRTEDNDISIDHRSLSRTHAKLVREESGEWRIIDMQSANGMAVNGESYAQSSLAHGDLIELGHVKLRFVGPGQSTEGLLNERAANKGGGSSKKVLLAVVGVVVLAVVAGVGWMLLGRGPATPVQPPQPAAVVEQKPSKPEPVRTPEPNPAPRQPPAEDALAKQEEKLRGAQASIDARDFAKAVATLESIKDANGQRPAKAQELLEQAQEELALKKTLDQAQQAFDAGKYEEARKQLEASAGTISFADEHAVLTEQVDEALEPKSGTRPVAGTVRRGVAEQTKQFYDDSVVMVKKQQFKEANFILKKCIALDPNYGPCYLMLGVAAARRDQMEEGAKYYREFLRLSPDHERAPKVRQMLEVYEQQKTQPGGGQ